MAIIQNGKPLIPDRRDARFLHSKKFGLAALHTLPPQGLGRVPYKINQQGDTFFCTAAGTSSAAEYEAGRKFSFEFQVAAISRRVGKPILDGAEPRLALQARVAYGCLPDEMTPAHLRLDPEDAEVIADWREWRQDLWDAARAFVAEGFFWLGEEYEPFDQVREALWSARAENQVVMANGRWYQSWNNVRADGILPAPTGGYALHEYAIIDWRLINGSEYLVIQNSCGKSYGDKGLQYIDRATMNAAWPRAWGDGTGMAIWRKVNPQDINSLKRQWLSLAEVLAGILDKLVFKLRYGIR